nr:MAG TPA: major tropism determinant [Caudoviricetes sp.]
MAKRVAQMGNTAEKVAAYTGIPKQIVVDTTTWRPHIMDGSTAGGHPVAMQSDLSAYLKTTAKAASAAKADTATSATSATKATQDASGNVITTTYATKTEAATKTELSTGLAAKAPAYTYGTEDLTAGTSALETGKLYFVYEE